MILAAGRGERMRPLTDVCPKPLLQVNGKPLIVYHIEALRRAGIDSIVINTSWLADQIVAALGDGSDFGVNIHYSYEPQALETAGGIIHALPLLDDEFIVVNGDVYCDFNFSQLAGFERSAQLVLVDNPAHHPKGDFALCDGLLMNRGDELFTFAGIAAYRKSFFNDLPDAHQALAPLLRKAADDEEVSAQYFSGRWSDVGTVERLQALNY
jgi:MurNAc alpha-1-phosphate uridylyltransferase